MMKLLYQRAEGDEQMQELKGAIKGEMLCIKKALNRAPHVTISSLSDLLCQLKRF